MTFIGPVHGLLFRYGPHSRHLLSNCSDKCFVLRVPDRLGPHARWHAAVGWRSLSRMGHNSSFVHSSVNSTWKAPQSERNYRLIGTKS